MINKKKTDICIVGLGYVGIPLAISFPDTTGCSKPVSGGDIILTR